MEVSKHVGAETQIMSEALTEVEWIRGLFEELTNPRFTVVQWAARSQNRSSDAGMRYPKVLSIGDAKSLDDHLSTNTSGGAIQHGRRGCFGKVGGPQRHVC